MNNLDKQYQDLLQDILDNGVKKETRNGGTISVFGRQIRHNMSEGFPLLTTKKMFWKGIVTELIWFLRGDTNIKYLIDNDCHIWDGDAYKNYGQKIISGGYQNLVAIGWPSTQEEFINKIKTDDEFAKKWGDLGPVYGRQWRAWGGFDKKPSGWNHGAVTHFSEVPKLDQIKNLIHDLKTNPDSRRLMVTAWNPSELDQMTLPPCHYGFQIYTREFSLQERKDIYDKSSYVKDIFPTDENGWNSLFNDCSIPTRAISLMFNMRSNDVPLGLPFNLASYGLLLMILAKEVNMVPEELISNMVDCHIYLNQIDGVKEQLTREPFELPTLNQFPTYEGSRPSIESYTIGDFTLKNYKSHPSIKMPLSN
jgi:thymidylate synthase